MITHRLEALACRDVLGRTRPEELIAAAVEAIADGQDSRSLRVLAGLTIDDNKEAQSLFAHALAELGIATPNRREAVLCLAQDTARDILNRQTAPHVGARRIWEFTLAVPEEDFAELDTFVYAASEWDERTGDHGSFIEGIESAARQLLKSQ